MPADNSALLDLATEEILTYLGDHPQAADSLRGITHWWLRHRNPPISEDIVLRALDRLMGEGSVTRQHSPGGHILYRRQID